MTTLNQQARGIVGHEEYCPEHPSNSDLREGDSCTCPPLPLHARVAAGLGDLRREHDFSVCEWERVDWRCFNCALHTPIDEDTPEGPCVPPLDAARSWRLMVALHGVDLGYHGGRWAAERVWEDASDVETSMSRGADTPKEAVALLFEALCDAGLISKENI